jgi:hypothetical protein
MGKTQDKLSETARLRGGGDGQKVVPGRGHEKKMLKNDIQSRNVYENKQNNDTLTGINTDNFA